ncbi:MAG: DUF1275 domain-containing protein [Myxococcaceae bacterium]|jgi:uncharacterized membrane protein YoaK (UPF0700 family)|nr:DUF1275 domain-containing protein [Myxococcaceae bacterium]
MPLSSEGKARSFHENLTLARTLPAVAGMVNVIGSVHLGYYTSHVTGLVSGVGLNVARARATEAGFLVALVGAFIAGAMLASALIELAKVRHWPRYQLPLLIEALLLAVITLAAVAAPGALAEATPSVKALFAGALCVSLGLQNALVARLSGAVVRTTHVTGVATDLGIELVRVARWYLEHSKDKTLRDHVRDLGEVRRDAQLYRVRLYLAILASFLAGATAGALLDAAIGLLALAMPILMLVALVVYDRLLGVSEEELEENFNPRFSPQAVVQQPGPADGS